MNRSLKNALKQSYEAPAPTQKSQFLRRFPVQSIGHFQFLCIQITYIRKWVWALSVFSFIVAFIGAAWLNQDMLWCISAYMPILALSAITESSRSQIYGMSEFEISTRFSLKALSLPD